MTDTPAPDMIVHLDSLPDVLRYLDRTPAQWRGDASHKPGSNSWDLGLGWKGAEAMCKTGWSEGGKDMRMVLKGLPRTQGSAMEIRYNPVRGQFSFGRYVTGNPVCFRRKVKDADDSVAPIVRLAINNATPFTSKAKNLHNYGAAIAAAVEALELAGTRVELSVHNVCLCGDGRKRLVTGWTIKHAGEPLDMAAVAFSIAHPAAQRRIGFALKERTPRAYEDSGYGYPRDLALTDVKDAPALTVVLNGSRDVNSHAATPADAVAYVQERISEALGNRA